jgi:hypothetical protein
MDAVSPQQIGQFQNGHPSTLWKAEMPEKKEGEQIET